MGSLFNPGQGDYPLKQEKVGVRWVMPGWYYQVVSNRQVQASWIYAVPIFVEKVTTYIRIGIKVTTFVAGNADLRIFNSDDGLPTSQILSAGTVDTGSNGAKEITIAQLLKRGYYFLTVRCTANPTLTSIDVTKPLKPPQAGMSITHGNPLSSACLSTNGAYADPADATNQIIDPSYAYVTLREE